MGREPKMGITRPPQERRGDDNERVKYEGCNATIPKGAKGEVVDAKLADHTMVCDTGRRDDVLEQFDSLSPEEIRERIDDIYKATIAIGVVDHHAIDAFLLKKKIEPEKCATQMVADYPEAVLEAIQKHGFKKVDTHVDSDMDAITSSYLIKSLMDNGKLPTIGKEIAAVVNEVDFGKYPIANTEEFMKTLPGFFDKFEAYFYKLQDDELGAEVFSRKEFKQENGRLNQAGINKLIEIKTKFREQINAKIFDFYNALNELKIKYPKFNLEGDISKVLDHLPKDMQEILNNGTEILREKYEKFFKEFDEAEKFEGQIPNREGEPVAVKVIMAENESPLVFTNLSYKKAGEYAVIAVFAGGPEERKGGDRYDIGVTPEMGQIIDFSELCMALNKAEMAKRQEIYDKPEDQRTELEKQTIAKIEASGDRDAFKGVDESITKKDPTVIVAGGSLIAASNNGLLSAEEFKQVVRNTLGK